MDAELSELFQRLSGAFGPEDVFGDLSGAADGDREAELERNFRALARRCHPDRFASSPEARDLAHQTFQMLADMHRRGRAKLSRGSYGVREARDDVDSTETADITTARHTFRISRTPFCEGDLCRLYRGSCLGGDGEAAGVVVKLARESEDNDFVRNEIRVLGRLWAEPAAQLKHLPQLLDRFVSEGRQGLVLRELDAVDLTVVRDRYPDGLEPQHCAWILARVLSALGFAHSRGIVHGNVEPAHILIRPRDHNAFLIDWSYAAVEPAKTGEGFRILNELYSAPEVGERKPPIPASDIYSLGKVIIWLLGGDPDARTMPAQVAPRFRRFLEFLTLPSARGRAQDAWEMFRELRQVREELWGGPHYLELEL